MKRNRWILAAVCLMVCAAVCLGLAAARRETPVEGSAETPNAGPTVYTGPVLPLTVPDGELSARRHITADLSRTDQAIVTDQYVLTNPTDAARTVTLLYPFTGSFTSPAEIIPTLTVDGAAAETELAAGDYVGGFSNTRGEEALTPEEMFNLRYPQDGEGYLQKLQDPAYGTAALEDPALPRTPLVVYSIHRPEDPEQQVEFSCTASEDLVLWPIGYHSAAGEGNRLTYTFRSRPEMPAEVLVLGGDVTDISLDSGSYTRTETTLRDYLPVLAGYPLGYAPDYETVADRTSAGILVSAAARWLADYGPFGTTPAVRYELGLDILGDLRSVERIFFAVTEVTVPAGGSVTVEAVCIKEASYQSGQAEKHYEWSAQPTHGLTFTEQTLTVVNTGAVLVTVETQTADGTDTTDTVGGPAEPVALDAETLWVRLIRS